MRAQAANDAALGALSHAPSPDPFKTPKKLGCGMVFKPHSCFLEQMLAMLRYPMRSSRKRSVEPSRTYAFQPKTERGTLPDHLLRGSGASWDRFDKGVATPPESCSKPRPNAFRKTGLHPCVFKPQTTRRWEPRRTHPPQTPSKPKKNWGAAWCLSPIRVF